MTRDLCLPIAGLIRAAATTCCLAATLLVAACGTPASSDYPAFNLTPAPDTERPGERP
jgi:hypothetical protein